MTTPPEERILSLERQLAELHASVNAATAVSEAFNRSIIESSVDCIKVLDLNGILLAMPNGERILGVDCVESFLNTTWFNFWKDGDLLAAQEAVKAAASGKTQSFTGFFRTSLNAPRWWHVVVSPILDVEGKPARLLAMSRDITDKKQAEDALNARTVQLELAFKELAESEWRLKHAAAAAGLTYVEIDSANGQLTTPENFASVMGYLEPESNGDGLVASQSFISHVHPEDRDRVASELQRFFAGAPTGMLDYRVIGDDHLERWIETRWGSVLDARFSPSKKLATNLNITERKKTEKELQLREERFRALVTASADVVYQMSPDWRVMHQLDGRGFLNSTSVPNINWLQEYIHPNDQVRVMAVVDEAIRTKRFFQMEHQVLSVDGSLGWTSSHAVPVFDATGEIVEWFGTASNVTEQKRAQVQLQESDERYRTLFNSIDEGFCVIEMLFDAQNNPVDYLHLEINPSFEKLTGISNATGMKISELVPTLELFWFQVYGEVAQTGKPIRFENKATSMDDQWFDVYAFRIGGEQSRKVALLFTNITARKRAEQLLLDQSHKLVEEDRRKNEFLAMLSHELRNPLAPIVNALHLLEMQPGETKIQKEARSVIDRQVRQLTRHVDELLDVSRINTGQVLLRHEHVFLNSIIDGAIETTQPLILQRQHKLTVEIPREPISLFADATRLEQVIVNLLSNASKYTDKGGLINLAVRREDDFAILTVTDTGIGIAPELLPHIFDLFTQAARSLDRSEGGMGIGLCLVKRLVELHGGTVAAQSTAGRGSLFTVRLPLVSTTISTLDSESIVSPIDLDIRELNACHVLVVDDNVDAANTLALLIEMSGHKVSVSHEGFSALAAVQASLPHVVVLDIGLPGLSGYEVARRIRLDDRLKGIVLIALTGYGKDSDVQTAMDAGFNYHLVKPSEFEVLEKIIDTVASSLASSAPVSLT